MMNKVKFKFSSLRAVKIFLLGLSLFLLVLLPLHGQSPSTVEVTMKVKLPYQLPQDATVYLAGNIDSLGQWKADFIPLQRRGKALWECTVTVPRHSRLQFKFTLGKWAMVEKGPQGEEISNRILQVQGKDTHYFQVHNWNNIHLLKNELPTWTGTIETIGPFYSKSLKNYRKAWVYLPPGYAQNPQKSYPVIYFHDGNNVFNAKSAFGGTEWKVDETVQGLIHQAKIQKIIVVAVANTSRRMDEYTPSQDPHYGGGKAQAYGRLLVQTIKPYVDSHYRTLKSRKHTGVAGSSLGGLASLYLGLKYPQVFSKIAVISPSLWWNQKSMLARVQKESFSKSYKIWLDMGTREGKRDQNNNGIRDSLEEARQLRDILIKKGFKKGKSLEYYEAQGAGHSEWFWSRRVWRPLVFFFEK